MLKTSPDFLWCIQVHILKAADLKPSLYIENLKDFFQYEFGPALKVRLYCGSLGGRDTKNVSFHILSFLQMSL